MINYQNISDSILFYEKLGYLTKEAPWWVFDGSELVTKPPGAIDFHIQENKAALVASAEQSFISLMRKKELPEGKYQATTPCFRDDSLDEYHHKYFLKNELINTKEVNDKTLHDILNNAFSFFSTKIHKSFLSVQKTKDGFDIIAKIQEKEIELGSYGIRRHLDLAWVYGTGCAEPRLSRVQEEVSDHSMQELYNISNNLNLYKGG